MIRILLISAGTVSLALGIIGIFIPVLPTTPFVILSAGLYVKSSPALYERVIRGRITSRYMTREGGRKAGVYALVIMWLMIAVTAVFATTTTWLRIILIVIGITGTIFKIIYFFGKNHTQIIRNR